MNTSNNVRQLTSKQTDHNIAVAPCKVHSDDFSKGVTLVGFEGGVVFNLDGDACIGRSGENEIALPGDPSLSRRHAMITRLDDKYYLRDLRSSNGTFLNGKKVHGSILLKPDDVIFFGKTLMIFTPTRHKLAALGWKLQAASNWAQESMWSMIVRKAMLALVNQEFVKTAQTRKVKTDTCKDLPKAV